MLRLPIALLGGITQSLNGQHQAHDGHLTLPLFLPDAHSFCVKGRLPAALRGHDTVCLEPGYNRPLRRTEEVPRQVWNSTVMVKSTEPRWVHIKCLMHMIRSPACPASQVSINYKLLNIKVCCWFFIPKFGRGRASLPWQL